MSKSWFAVATPDGMCQKVINNMELEYFLLNLWLKYFI